MDRVFDSKRDLWLGLLIWAGALVNIIAGLFLLRVIPAASLIMLPLGGLILWTWYRTFYRLTGKDIIVRSGPFRWTVKVADIREVYPTDNPRSSPASSLDRLRIESGGGRWIMISPRDKEDFLKCLTAADDGLVLQDGKIARKDR
jgi:hypothetical protein